MKLARLPFPLFVVFLALAACEDVGGISDPDDPGSGEPPPEEPAPPLPPESPAGVYFAENFETDDWVSAFHAIQYSERLEILTGPGAGEGTRSLIHVFDPTWHNAGSLAYYFTMAGLPEPESLYGRYYLYFDADFEPGEGGKLPGPSGTYDRAGWGGRPADGTNGWSARMGFHTPDSPDESRIGIHYYAYHVDSGTWGEWIRWYTDPSQSVESELGLLERGRWYCIETYVKLNDPGQRNGILRGWVDGQLACERTDLIFRTVPDLKVEAFWWNFYYGGVDYPEQRMHVRSDAYVLSPTYIGPIGSTSP
jgi:hypothetical protein